MGKRGWYILYSRKGVKNQKSASYNGKGQHPEKKGRFFSSIKSLSRTKRKGEKKITRRREGRER